MQKLILTNRKGQKMVGILTYPDGEVRGTCVIQHGYSGFKEQIHIETIQNIFLKHGFITFNFDATNSFNESDGDFEEATLGLHYEDFKDAVEWVKQQEWFKRPLALTGHSMGGYAVARYAEDHPGDVDLIAPIAPLVSGELGFEAKERAQPGILEIWKKQGYIDDPSTSAPSGFKRKPWKSMEERLNHDLLPKASRISVPTLIVVGSEDTSCPPDHVQQLFDALTVEDKEFKVIEGAPHTYKEEGELKELESILDSWLLSH